MAKEPPGANSPVLLETALGRLPPTARQLLLDAGQEARRLGHRWVGTNHLAIAAISASHSNLLKSVPSAALARARLEDLLGRGSAQESDPLQITPGALRLLEQCQEEAGGDFSPEDVLDAVIQSNTMSAATVLKLSQEQG